MSEEGRRGAVLYLGKTLGSSFEEEGSSVLTPLGADLDDIVCALEDV